VTEQKQKKRAEKKEKLPKPTKTEPKPQVNESVVLIGQKPVKNYVIACLTHFSTGSNKVVVKARGRAICRAVDTVELLRRVFLKDVQLETINTCTEEVEREGGRKANVSAIEIVLIK